MPIEHFIVIVFNKHTKYWILLFHIFCIFELLDFWIILLLGLTFYIFCIFELFDFSILVFSLLSSLLRSEIYLHPIFEFEIEFENYGHVDVFLLCPSSLEIFNVEHVLGTRRENRQRNGKRNPSNNKRKRSRRYRHCTLFILKPGDDITWFI